VSRAVSRSTLSLPATSPDIHATFFPRNNWIESAALLAAL
jgi:hypothetical protein